MRKESDITNKPVLTFQDGSKVAKVQDVIFDPKTNKVVGLLTDEGGWFSKAQILPLSHIKSIGEDAVIIDNEDKIIAAEDDDNYTPLLEAGDVLKHTKVLTESGKDLGTIVDLQFNEQTGAVEGYEVSGGIFADAYNGCAFIPAPKVTRFGEDVLFVPDSTADLVEKQAGGLKGAVRDTSTKAQAQTQNWKTKAQAKANSPETQDALRSTKEQAASLWKEVKEGAKNFTEEARQKIEEKRIEGAVGRPVTRAILDNNDQPILDTGDIITNAAIKKAEAAGVLSMLLNSVDSSKPALNKEQRRVSAQHR